MKEVKTVRELIDILSKLDPESVPLIHDGDWGYLLLGRIEVGKIELDPENRTKYQNFKRLNDGGVNRHPTAPAIELGFWYD